MADDGLSIAAVYLAYFGARTDAYSIPIAGAKGWEAKREELTPEIILAGLTRKGPPVSGYMLRPDNTTHVFAIDFDTPDGLKQAMRMIDAMANDKVPAYVETSRRGAHLWCVGLDPLPGKVIRRAMRSWLKDAGLPTDEPKIELRPAQDEIYPDNEGRAGLGTCLRLPMMPHPTTGKQGKMVGVGGEKLGDRIRDVLLEIEYARMDPIIEASTRWVQKVKPGDIPDQYRQRKRYADDDPVGVAEVLRSKYGILNAAPGKAVRCKMHDDRVASLSILRDDKRVICRGGGCPLNNDGHGRGKAELLKLAPIQ